MSVCPKFQLSSWSRSDCKVWLNLLFRVAGWLEKGELMLTSALVWVEVELSWVEAELGNKTIFPIRRCAPRNDDNMSHKMTCPKRWHSPTAYHIRHQASSDKLTKLQRSICFVSLRSDQKSDVGVGSQYPFLALVPLKMIPFIYAKSFSTLKWGMLAKSRAW